MSPMRVPYAQAVYGIAEVVAVCEVLDNPLQIGAGPKVAEFERRIADLFGMEHGVMVNSGSSANLLALKALDLPEGSEVITPALTFATCVAPIVQLGLRPVFVDIEPATYSPPPIEIVQAVTDATSAILVPLLLGTVPDLRVIAKGAAKRGHKVVVDSCDTLDARFWDRPVGHYADVCTTSFYASHVITAAGGGGMACFSDRAVADRARVLAAWGRTQIAEDDPDRLAGDYDAKFTFPEMGYNFQALELQGAFGCVQLGRLPAFIEARRANFARMYHRLEVLGGFVLPEIHPHATANWLAFPIQVTSDAYTRTELQIYLESCGIQTRPIMAGNILRQPGFQHLGDPDAFPLTDSVHRSGLLVGCHQGLDIADIDYVCDAIERFVRQRLGLLDGGRAS